MVIMTYSLPMVVFFEHGNIITMRQSTRHCVTLIFEYAITSFFRDLSEIREKTRKPHTIRRVVTRYQAAPSRYWSQATFRDWRPHEISCSNTEVEGAAIACRVTFVCSLPSLCFRELRPASIPRDSILKMHFLIDLTPYLRSVGCNGLKQI
jgi:hypothetical protein